MTLYVLTNDIHTPSINEACASNHAKFLHLFNPVNSAEWTLETSTENAVDCGRQDVPFVTVMPAYLGEFTYIMSVII